MKMKKLIVFLFAILAVGFRAYPAAPPDEGMWLPIFVEELNYEEMKEMGLRLSAEDIYNINNSSIKDAVVGLSRGSTPSGFFCTAEVVSDEGLIFTNHHCGYNYIQKHSTVEQDYLADGFWAMSKEEELANPGLSVTFFKRMEDVTDSIIPFLSDTMTEGERAAKVRELSNNLKDRASGENNHHVVVKGFFGGNEYYLFVYEVFTDVRLVGAPPSSIGKFGGDTDNWMWPRHTGDFSIFRIYSAPDGSPAKYAEDNIPLKPKHHLPVSVAGYEEGDFSMIWGYPGSTDRYLTSYGIKFNLDFYYPNLVKIFGEKLNVWKEDMDTDQTVKIQYASKYAGISNYHKYMIGQERGLRKLNVYLKKKEQEEKFLEWVRSDPERKKKYGDVLDNLKNIYEGMGKDFTKMIYTAVAASGGPELLGFAQGFGQLYNLLDKKAEESIIEETIAELRESSEDFFKDYNTATDEKVTAAMLELYYNEIPEDFLPEVFTDMVDDFKGDFDAMARDIFDESNFSTQEKVNDFLEKPKARKIKKDPAYQLAKAFTSKLMEAQQTYGQLQQDLKKNNRLFIAGLREMHPDKVFYPNANSTMRLSYGTVQDYYPADAVYYNYYTTLAGVMEKEDPDNDEFIVEDKLKELYKNKEFGRYGETIDGMERLITCFLTTHDITGGNSGSPVINGNGELIGIAFDGNWEAMSGDIAFEPDLQRTINVDIRYVLFIIDKFANAQNLMEELTIVDKKPVKAEPEVTSEAMSEEKASEE